MRAYSNFVGIRQLLVLRQWQFCHADEDEAPMASSMREHQRERIRMRERPPLKESGGNASSSRKLVSNVAVLINYAV